MYNKILILLLFIAVIPAFAFGEELFSLTRDQIYISNDGGHSWKDIYVDSNSRISYNHICFDKKNKAIFVAASNCVLKSTNNGKNWKQLKPSGDDENINKVFASNDGRLYAMSLDSLYVSSNGGASWAALTLPSTQLFHIEASGKRIYAAGGDRLYVSGDGGNSWKKRNTSAFSGGVISDIAMCPYDSSCIYVATSCGLFFSSNSGQSFSNVSISPKKYIVTEKIVWEPNNCVYALDTDTKPNGFCYLRRSGNGGKNWVVVASKESIGNFCCGYPSSGTIYYSYTSTKDLSGIETTLTKIAKSHDGGVSWKTVDSILPSFAKTRYLVIRPW